MIEIAHLPNGSRALKRNETNFTRGKTDVAVPPLLGDKLSHRTSSPNQLPTFPPLKFYVVDEGPKRHAQQRERVADLDRSLAARHDSIVHPQSQGSKYVPLLTISIGEQSNPSRPVWIILD